MSGQGDPTIEKIVSLYGEEDYFGIIRIFRDSVDSDSENSGHIRPSRSSAVCKLHLVTWVLPGVQDLRSFAKFVLSNDIRKIYSIGCGTGLLEWLIIKFLQLEGNDGNENVRIIPELVGVEVDSQWWRSSYSPPQFLPLQYYGETFQPENGFAENNDMAIFCYFNNNRIFADYLRLFNGDWVVLIGPISTSQFCAPGPKELSENSKELPTQQWELITCDQFGFVLEDHLAIYRRRVS